MSSEADVFFATNFIGGGATVTFTIPPVDDAYWSVSAVPQGTNNSIRITSQFIDSDASGVRHLHYTVQNLTSNPTNFTRGRVRIPNA